MSRRSSSAPAFPLDPSEPPPPKAALHTQCTESKIDADVLVEGGGFDGEEDKACSLGGPLDPWGQ